MSPLPMAMDARGAPPIPGIQLNAAVIMIMGNVMPMPPRAMVPTPGICPIYFQIIHHGPVKVHRENMGFHFQGIKDGLDVHGIFQDGPGVFISIQGEQLKMEFTVGGPACNGFTGRDGVITVA